ncbi:cyclic nucleotide-binding domain-containing protein [Nostoc sp. CMAA1605]|uniref:cyclic nucleotide-binding domain-containing protein n=1 Tax=Nostoc sp. CMAA1605 TaxID=2055159 RepID=UPI001F18A578|nr:cyclic nucleotide-binding domain-containing protein [Nostoc sp. CMAA1605]
MTYASEEIIVRQGEPATKFYILLEGDVEVFQDFPDQPTRLLNRLSRGDYLGKLVYCGVESVQLQCVLPKTQK